MNRSRSFRMRGIAAVRIVVTMPRQSRERPRQSHSFSINQALIRGRKVGFGRWLNLMIGAACPLLTTVL